MEELGVRPIINAENWSTASVGGSTCSQEVLDVMCDVEKVYCNIDELLTKCCDRVAKICKAKASFITCGAAAGIYLSTVACLIGKDHTKAEQLYGRVPKPENFKDEVIMALVQSSHYDYHYLQANARLVLVGTAFATTVADYEKAMSPKTAAIAWTESFHNAVGRGAGLPIENIIDLSHKHGLPFVLDAAGVPPPRSAMHRFTDMGTDLVIFSGGKAIEGPNDTGLILAGTDRGVDLVEAIRSWSFPRDGYGRHLKVSKGQIAGLTKAVEIFMSKNEDEEYAKLMKKAEWMMNELKDIPGLQVNILPNDEKYFEHPVHPHVPMTHLEWDDDEMGLTDIEFSKLMMEDPHPISVRPPRVEYIFSDKCQRNISTYCLKPGEEKTVVEKIRETFTKYRKQKSARTLP